jgi:hypothetical protein
LLSQEISVQTKPAWTIKSFKASRATNSVEETRLGDQLCTVLRESDRYSYIREYIPKIILVEMLMHLVQIYSMSK